MPHKHKHKHNSSDDAWVQTRGSKDAYNTSTSIGTSRINVLVLVVLALMSNDNALLKACALARANICHLVLVYRESTEPKFGNYQICACLRTYACVKGVFASVIIMYVRMSYKKSKLWQSAWVGISYISEYFLPAISASLNWENPVCVMTCQGNWILWKFSEAIYLSTKSGVILKENGSFFHKNASKLTK